MVIVKVENVANVQYNAEIGYKISLNSLFFPKAFPQSGKHFYQNNNYKQPNKQQKKKTPRKNR